MACKKRKEDGWRGRILSERTDGWLFNNVHPSAWSMLYVMSPSNGFV